MQLTKSVSFHNMVEILGDFACQKRFDFLHVVYILCDRKNLRVIEKPKGHRGRLHLWKCLVVSGKWDWNPCWENMLYMLWDWNLNKFCGAFLKCWARLLWIWTRLNFFLLLFPCGIYFQFCSEALITQNCITANYSSCGPDCPTGAVCGWEDNQFIEYNRSNLVTMVSRMR